MHLFEYQGFVVALGVSENLGKAGIDGRTKDLTGFLPENKGRRSIPRERLPGIDLLIKGEL
jgi:hypothetical protein